MLRAHRALLFAAALTAAPLAFAQPAFGATPEPSTASAQAPAAGGDPIPAQAIPRPELGVPPTPMPLSLPDPARPEEVSGKYAIGIFTLAAGVILSYLFVLALVYFTVRRSWTTAH